MSTRLHYWIKQSAILMAVEAVIVIIGSYYLSFYVATLYHFPLPRIGGLWGAISAVFVLSPKREDVLRMAEVRFLGTLVGALVTCAFVYLFAGYFLYTFAISLFFVILLVGLLHIRETYKVACITALVVFIVGWITQQQIAPWLNAVSRLLESVIGIAISLLFDLAFYPLRKRFDLF